MSRNFYVLAATLLLLSLVSCGLTFVPSSFQPELPANASLWKSLGTFLFLIALVAALIGSMSHLFEQVDRRTEQRRRSERERRRKGF
jgi:O-antigen ligase